MTMYLALDTETTGFAKSGSLIQDGQARVCQIAMILFNEKGRIFGEFSTLVKLDPDVKINSGAYGVHGISESDCHNYGMDQNKMIYIYKYFLSQAEKIIAHNEKFDRNMMDIECSYFGDEQPRVHPWHCTMQPNSGLIGGKSLANCYKHYTGKNLSGAHDAMVDTRACMEIFLAMNK